MITKPNRIPSSLEEDFPIGLIVENFLPIGARYQAVVVGYHAGCLVVKDNHGDKWLADPNKCTVPLQRPVRGRKEVK